MKLTKYGAAFRYFYHTYGRLYRLGSYLSILLQTAQKEKKRRVNPNTPMCMTANMKTKVYITHTNMNPMGDSYKQGDTGFVDGYVRGGDGRPYAVVVLHETGDSRDKMFVLVPTYALKLNENP